MEITQTFRVMPHERHAMEAALLTHQMDYIMHQEDGKFCYQITTSLPGMLFYVGRTYQLFMTETYLKSTKITVNHASL